MQGSLIRSNQFRSQQFTARTIRGNSDILIEAGEYMSLNLNTKPLESYSRIKITLRPDVAASSSAGFIFLPTSSKQLQLYP